MAVNPRYTATELRHVLTTSGTSLLVIQADYIGAFEELAGEMPSLDVLVVGGDGERWDAWEPSLAAATPLAPGSDHGSQDDTVSLLFTSGTTGFPKGVMIPQRYWLHMISLYEALFDFPVRRRRRNETRLSCLTSSGLRLPDIAPWRSGTKPLRASPTV